MAGDFIGIMLGLWAQVHQPVIDAHVVFKAMGACVVKVHFSDKPCVVPIGSKVMRYSAVAPVKQILVAVSACSMRVQACKHGAP
jgi:hypothetical protein